MFASLKKLWKLSDRRMRYRSLYILFLMILGSLLEVLGIGMMLPILQLAADPSAGVTNNQFLAWLNDHLTFHSSASFMMSLCVGVFLLYLAKNLFNLWIINEQYQFSWGMLTYFTHRLFRRYLREPYALHIQRNSSDLLRNINFSVPAIFGALLTPMMTVASEVLIAFAVLAFLIWLQPLIALSAIAGLALVALVFLKLAKQKLKIWAERNQTSRGEMMQWPNQAFGGFKQIKALGREGFFDRAFERSALANAGSQRKFALVNNIPRALMEIFAVGGILLTLALTLAFGTDLTTQIPVIGAFCLAVIRVLPIATRIITQVNLMKHGIAAMGVVYEDLNDLPTEFQAFSERPTVPFKLDRELKIENVSFAYNGNSAPILNSINLSIPRGTAIAFVGASGAGKSTLADILLGLLDPTEGRVLVDSKDIAKCIEAWRAGCGYIPQEVFLIDDTVERNVALGIEDGKIDTNAVRHACKLAQLGDVIEELPQGLDTRLGERGVRLSGGQRQRVSIARSLYHDPSVLVLDEATSALDNETEKEISAAIDELSGDKTLIIIAHRLTTVRHCDRIILLDKGKIIDDGTFEELAARSSAFRQMLEHGGLVMGSTQLQANAS